MITNTHIDLSHNSQTRIDAINSIKYTLLLDYQIPEYNDDKRLFLSNVFDNCQKCCYGLFYDPVLIVKDNENQFYNFFGTKSTLDVLQMRFRNLNIISSKIDMSTRSDPITYLHNFILQHCVMSSYHAILTELKLNKTITSEELKINTKHLNYHRKTKKEGNYSQKTKIKNFNNTSFKHFSALPFLKDLIIYKQNREDIIFVEQFAELWYHICDANATKLNSCFLKREKTSNKKVEITEKTRKECTQNEIENFFVHDNGDSAPNMLFPKYLENSKPTPKDRPKLLYHYYLTERIFNFRLFYCTLKAIDFVNQSRIYRLDQMDLIQSLVSVTSLPNVFSRQLFLMYAILRIEQNTASHKDFWSFKSLEYNIKDYDSIYEVFDIYKWSRQLELVSNYFSKFIIPVYEWCFIGMLFDGIENANGTDHEKNLLLAKGILEKFMVDHYNCFLSPYIEKENSFTSRFPKSYRKIDDDMFNFTIDMQKIYFDSELSPEYLTKLFNSFFYELRNNNNNLDLNLSTKLTPDYFKKDSHKQDRSSYEKIRLFYLDLLRSKHWE